MVAVPRWWFDTRTDWPTDRRSLDDFDFATDDITADKLVMGYESVLIDVRI
jgi:hypothetical protein